MPIEEAVVRRLLADARVRDFDGSPVFRSIAKDPAAADILVNILREGRGETAARARRMLCLFDEVALPALMRGLMEEGSLWRSDLLHIIWTILAVYEPEAMPRFVAALTPGLVELFRDKSVVAPTYEFPIEVEYRYRVCDEAYVLVQRMRDPEFDESTLRGESLEERDAEIRLLRGRLERGTV